MNEDDWRRPLESLPDEEILNIHFTLQEKIKKLYKKRDVGGNLIGAIEACKQQIALAPLTLKAMKNLHDEEVKEYEEITGGKHPNPDFYIPSHYGFDQYMVILRKQKRLSDAAELQEKMKSFGWHY